MAFGSPTPDNVPQLRHLLRQLEERGYRVTWRQYGKEVRVVAFGQNIGKGTEHVVQKDDGDLYGAVRQVAEGVGIEVREA